MGKRIAFSPADILLPMDCGLTKWAVVACDQYTSQPEYWERVAEYVGDAPSSLHLILPENKLNSDSVQKEIKNIHKTMEQYLKEKRFRKIEETFLYVERILANGSLRRGILGKIDLEQYSYEANSKTPVRATEGTVLSRIPPRKQVRSGAAIELPHIMVLIDDPDKTVIEPLSEQKKQMHKNYICNLMENGGMITGYTLSKDQIDQVLLALKDLADPVRFSEHYNAEGKAVLTFAIGDGNHSLATAKACWEEVKKKIPKKDWMAHPARYALVELGNLHEDSLKFDAIHRVVFDVNPTHLLQAFLTYYDGASLEKGEGHQIRYVYGKTNGTITIPNPEAVLEVATLQRFLDDYLAEHGGTVDYIHGVDVVNTLTKEDNRIGFLLPPMEKEQLFPSVIFDGPMPRKTFSVGEAHDKRFYMEARKIK